jgi:hypothetical protein
MVGKQKFDHQFASILNPLGVGFNHHLISHWKGAGGHQRPGPLDFHPAQTAGRGRGQIFPVAEMGNVDPCLSRGFKDGCTLFCLNFPSVNGQANFCHIISLFFSPQRHREHGKK